MLRFGIDNVEKAKKWHPECEFIHRFGDNFHHFSEIYALANGNWKRGDTYLSLLDSYEYNLPGLRKQEMLYDFGKKSTSCLMIGNRLYHAFLILLLSNPKLVIDCFNVDDPIVDYLNKHFDNRIRKYSNGSNYDLVHFDIDVYGSADLFRAFIWSVAPAKYVIINEHKQHHVVVQSYIESGRLIWVTSCESAMVLARNLHE